MSKNRNQKESESLSSKYEHQRMMDELDSLNHNLEEMKQAVQDTSVRAYILEAELATIFDPEVTAALDKASEAGDSCSEAIQGSSTKG